MKKWNLAALLPGFLALNNQVFADTAIVPNAENTFSPNDLIFAPLNTETPLYIAGHRSHSSHRSHRSHSSHRSSSGGGYYRSAPATPSYSAPATSNTQRNQSGNTRNSTSSNDYGPSVRQQAPTEQQRKRLVMRVQYALFDRGYFNGPIDGVMGPATRTAINNYRRSHGLPLTAYIDVDLLNSLGIYASS
ncbi:His-Xaa-Ser repeat protein HxsA [Providencia sp. PROV202]|uniref:His-Xaa-Ser repeat protein HxsA n=1 Tax=Providencia sp. PROV202 TaxID=2949902 RepID=UPI00234B45D5|nr:His-Xaa-Ser repeat protein HxsA [Providencia sp. PROV202]